MSQTYVSYVCRLLAAFLTVVAAAIFGSWVVFALVW